MTVNQARNKYDKTFSSNLSYNDDYDYYLEQKQNNRYNNPIYNVEYKNKNNKYDQNFFIANKENINIQTYYVFNNFNINIRTVKEKENKFEIFKNIKPKIKEKMNIENYPLNEQIKFSLQNIAKTYCKSDNFLKSSICNYYCGPFIDINIFGKNKDSVVNK